MNFHVVDNLTVITTNTLVKYGKLLRDQHGLVGKLSHNTIVRQVIFGIFFKDMVTKSLLYTSIESFLGRLNRLKSAKKKIKLNCMYVKD